MTQDLSTDLAVAELASAIEANAVTLADGGFRSDRDNADVADNMALIAELGVMRLHVPVEYGGWWDTSPFGLWGAVIRADTAVSTGDGPTGQNVGTTGMVARELLAAAGLPESTRAEVADRLLHDGLRLVSSNAETGVGENVIARPVPGGVILTGTKSFNTDSGGNGLANVGCSLDGIPGRYCVLVDLDAPGVERHGDWDNMGQRGTVSQTVTYHDVFVADGWHYQPGAMSPMRAAAVMLLHSALMQGISQGAHAAMIDYLRTMRRGIMPQSTSPKDDPLMLRRVGAVSSQLAASRALLFATADALESAGEPDRVSPQTAVDCFRTKVTCIEAALTASETVHELCGARGTSNAYRLDRFWRNARTFASHDPTDLKNVYVGMSEITGDMPPMSMFARG